jgi:hypothetical protein
MANETKFRVGEKVRLTKDFCRDTPGVSHKTIYTVTETHRMGDTEIVNLITANNRKSSSTAGWLTRA